MVTTRAQTAAAPPPSLPLKDYFASLSYLSLLLLSTPVVLPSSTSWFYDSGDSIVQATSADRPQWEFLNPITHDPAATAAWVSGGVAIVMVWWGNKLRKWWGLKADGKTKEAVLSTLGTTVLLALAMHTLGAPVAMYLRTLLFAFHLALLTAYPIIATLGFPDLYDAGIAARFRLTRLVCEWRAEDARERALAFPLAGALVGAWVGAIPLALDWDRPWQAWPLIPLVTSILGFVAGSWASFATSALESLRKEIADDQAANAPKPVAKKRKGKKSA